MKCKECGINDGRPLYRTAPKGVTPAGWTCEKCLKTLPDEDVKSIVDTIDGPRVDALMAEREG